MASCRPELVSLTAAVAAEPGASASDHSEKVARIATLKAEQDVEYWQELLQDNIDIQGVKTDIIV